MRLLTILMTSFLLAACSASSEAEQSADEADRVAEEALAAAGLDAPANTVPAGWRYEVDRDEMRGTEARFAMLESDSPVNPGWPYEAAPAQLVIRQRPLDGLKVMLTITGQFTCREYNGDTVAVKFDDGPIQNFRCGEPDSGGTGVLFIGSEPRFLESLKDAQKMMIEFPMYQSGPTQTTFTVAGLEWE
ncbi:hypothetical protein [Brevundimonas sp.]|uniref:hypothetical protein n=1 Tax=Brevundimonas sp. TaxID=1871086 RepID=UPI0035AEBF95